MCQLRILCKRWSLFVESAQSVVMTFLDKFSNDDDNIFLCLCDFFIRQHSPTQITKNTKSSIEMLIILSRYFSYKINRYLDKRNKLRD